MRSSGTRYVAVRADDVSRSFGRQRYGAVYDVDYGLARREARRSYIAVQRTPQVRYVAVRNDDDDDDVRYIAVRRSTPRVRYVAVRNIDIDDEDEPRYVAVRKIVPRTRYVAVRNIDIDDDDEQYVKLRRVAPRTNYVAVRNIDDDCPRAVALRSCLDEFETKSVKHVVIRDDDDDVIETKYVALRDESDDDDYVLKKEVDDDNEYIAVANHSPTYVEYRDASYSNLETPVAISTRTITYSTDDDDMDEKAFIDDDGAMYVAADDIEDACLSRQVVGTAPATVSYVSVEDDDEEVSDIATETLATVPQPRYVALDEDRVFNDLDPTWVEEVGPEVAATFNYVPTERVEVATEAASYVPIEAVEAIDAAPAGYVAVEDVEDVDTETVAYVPVAAVAETAVSYVPVNDVDEVDVRYVSTTKPVYVSGGSTVVVDEVDNDLVAELQGTQSIAGNFGYRDGFEDGQEAALEGDVFHPENSGDYQKASEGYEEDFGDKDVYKASYRASYLDGYRAGFNTGGSV